MLVQANSVAPKLSSLKLPASPPLDGIVSSFSGNLAQGWFKRNEIDLGTVVNTVISLVMKALGSLTGKSVLNLFR